MKTVKSNASHTGSILTALLIALFSMVVYNASAEEYTKTYKEKYTVEKGATLNITNKFGDVHCQNWDENSVAITVTVMVEASSQEKADKIFSKISVSLSGTSTRVDGTTSVGNMNNNGNFSIDYDVMLPKWMNIDLDNGFGEIYMDVVDGTAKIDCQYGAMKVKSLNGLGSDITAKFSEAEVGYFKDGQVHVEYGGYKSSESGNIELVSRFSQVDVDKVGSLNLDSQYDEINFGDAGKVISLSRFSGVTFDKISGSFEFDSEYGDIKVGYISPDFGTGKVRNSFAGTKLGFDPKASFNLDAELEFGDLSYPKGTTSVNKQTIGYTTNVYKGKFGPASNPTGQLTIKSKHADASLSTAQ